VLTETPPPADGAGGSSGADPGTAGVSAGVAGEAGAKVGPAPRCPTRFESVCSPKVVFENRDASASGPLFAEAIPDLTTTLPCITRDVCDTLYRKTIEAKNVTQITVIVEDYDGISETYGSGTEATIHMSSRYMQKVRDASGDLGAELRGILYYQSTNMYQFDGGDGAANAWVVEGVADFVRHAGGYLADDQRKAGGKYNDGFTTTAFFLIWLDARYPDFVYELNQSLIPNPSAPWSSQAFADITGESVADLWATYQQSL
jgi:hypothetical protein